MRRVLIVLTALLILPIAHAATIAGDVYELDLTPARDVVIAIDTVPHQQIVATDGSYTITVPAGSYSLTATERKNGIESATVTENITVAQDGAYTLDLILFPTFKANADLENDIKLTDTDIATGASANKTTTPTSALLYVGIGLAVVIAALIMFFIMKNRRPRATEVEPSVTDLDDLLSTIKKLGGRTTQKDLRKNLPYSEASVSLMLTELEHKGKIQKIKRGRANIIILK